MRTGSHAIRHPATDRRTLLAPIAGPGDLVDGELALVMPAPRAAIAENRRVAWIAPPHRPYAPAQQGLAKQGLERLWLVRGIEAEESAWAARSSSRAGCFVLCWAPLPAPATLRRLQFPAEHGGGCGFSRRSCSVGRMHWTARGYDQGEYCHVLQNDMVAF